jgi:hypothetical protein
MHKIKVGGGLGEAAGHQPLLSPLFPLISLTRLMCSGRSSTG